MERLRKGSNPKFIIILFAFLIVAFQGTVFGESESAELKSKKTTIFTPRGTPVNAMIYSGKTSSFQISSITDQWTTAIQSHDAHILSGAAYTYNCHGYAWYMSEGGNGPLHIENPQPYLADGSYRKIKAREAVKGDKVLYGDGVHSAVVADELGWVISKWGNGPLVKHRLRDFPPEFGPNLVLAFYRKVTSLSPPPNLRIVRVVK